MSVEYFRNDFGVVVTDTTVSDGKGGSYSVRNINSVRTIYHDIPWLKSFIKRAVIGSFLSLIITTFVSAAFRGNLVYILTFLATFGLTGFLCFKTYKRPRKIYSVILSTSGGEVESFSSDEPEEPKQICEAITKAMSEFGKTA